MNINPKAKTILCFGDSNTWGQTPHKNFRYPANERWTGILQAELGNDFYIIEEGLGGRNTDMEHYNPGKKGRNGAEYLIPCLKSHNPLDYVVLMLGTNDMKIQSHSTEAEGLSIDLLSDYQYKIVDWMKK